MITRQNIVLHVLALCAVVAGSVEVTTVDGTIDLVGRAEQVNLDWQRCLQFPFFQPLCLRASLHTCDSTIQAEVIYNNRTVGSAIITDLKTAEVCAPVKVDIGSFQCKVCMKFTPESFVLDAAYFNGCPQLRLNCSPLPEWTYPLGCIQLGTDCSVLGSCDTCASKSTCGWCPDKVGKQCFAQVDGKSCKDCSKSLLVTGGQCRAAYNTDPAKTTLAKVYLGLCLTFLLGTVGGMGFWFARRKMRREMEEANATGLQLQGGPVTAVVSPTAYEPPALAEHKQDFKEALLPRQAASDTV